VDLTLQDKNELLKAAIRTTDRDIADWLVTIVEQSDALPDGRRNTSATAARQQRVRPPARNRRPHPNPATTYRGDGTA